MPRAQTILEVQGSPYAREKTVHVVSQSKGGVGKSLVAWLLGQYFHDKGSTPVCLDTDPANHTFSRFERLKVREISLVEDNQIEIARFDEMVNQILAESGPFVVDTGSGNFLPFWKYISENELISFFAAQDRPMVVHSVLVGGRDLPDTVLALDSLCRLMPPQSVVVWLNGFWGPVRVDGKEFSDFQVYQNHTEKIIGSICFDGGKPSLQRTMMQQLLNESQTFAEAIEGYRNMIQGQRLTVMRREIYSQMEALSL
jgi:hypothetical protein